MKDYIDRHPGIGDVVLYAGILTAGEFAGDLNSTKGPENTVPEISLELYKDPDSFDSYLTLYLRQDSYYDDIAERLDRIFDEYEPALRSASGWLYVTTDSMPPKNQSFTGVF